MKLEEFLAEERRALELLEVWWRRGVATYRDSGDHDLFPDEMEPAQWDEQLAIFKQENLEDELIRREQEKSKVVPIKSGRHKPKEA